MKVSKGSPFFYFILIGILVVTFQSSANALTVRLNPNNVDRAPGNKVKVFIWADDAVNLISMGVKVAFDPALLQVVGASKYEEVWVLTDGTNSYTNPAVEINNSEGFVSMIGGHFTGVGTVGLSGSVLLGWIDFQANTGASGSSDLTVTLAHDTSPNFIHFVNLDGTPEEPGNIPLGGAVLGSIYVGADACEGNIAGDSNVNFVDLAAMKSQFGTDCSLLPPGQVCTCDLNGDGTCNFIDLAALKVDFGRDCP